jgi:CheY-like chemotaxis protein
MQQLNCLYLDDDAAQRERFKEWITREWDQLEIYVPIQVATVATPEEARTALRSNPNYYQLFVADILFKVPGKKEQEQLGLPAIAAARDAYSSLAIVALSIGNGGLEESAREAGADRYVSKAYLIRNPRCKRLIKAITEALTLRGHEQTEAHSDMLEIDETNLPLVSLADTVGRTNILTFTSRLLARQLKNAKGNFVKSGLSGAAVIKIDCNLVTTTGAPPEARSLLLKISRDSGALSAELAQDTTKFPESLFVPLMKTVPNPIGGWHCIGANFKLEAKTLLNWLQRSDVPKSQIQDTLLNLFSERQLGWVYRNPGHLGDMRPNAFLWDLLLLSRRARIAQELSELSDLAEKHDPLHWFDSDLVSRFIGPAKRVGNLDEEAVAKGTDVVHSHGDLHGGNILVDETGRAHLIDPANVKAMHWACDVARLIADLVVSGWDAETASYEWDPIEPWCKLALCLIRNEAFGDVPTEGSNARVYVAAAWIRSHLEEIYDCKNHPKPIWEFMLAVAIEFLRASYRRQELPPPKRVLGLLVGCEALRQAETAFRATTAPALPVAGSTPSGH